jgi:hypothetical protein
VRVFVATLCRQRVENVTGMVHSASTPAPDPSPVDLSTLLVHNPTGLGSAAGIVVSCTIETARDRPRSRSRPRSRPLPQRRLPSRTPFRGDGRHKSAAGRESTATGGAWRACTAGYRRAGRWRGVVSGPPPTHTPRTEPAPPCNPPLNPRICTRSCTPGPGDLELPGAPKPRRPRRLGPPTATVDPQSGVMSGK